MQVTSDEDLQRSGRAEEIRALYRAGKPSAATVLLIETMRKHGCDDFIDELLIELLAPEKKPPGKPRTRFSDHFLAQLYFRYMDEGEAGKSHEDRCEDIGQSLGKSAKTAWRYIEQGRKMFQADHEEWKSGRLLFRTYTSYEGIDIPMPTVLELWSHDVVVEDDYDPSYELESFDDDESAEFEE